MSRTRLLFLALLLAVPLTGCSGGNGNATPPTTNGASARTEPADVEAALTKAVREAVRADHRMSVRVLWSNAIPARPPATAGPALASLRRSVADRRRRGIRVRLVSERFQIVSVRLDPSYTRATAVVSDFQRAQPYGRDGRPLGRAVVLDERVTLDLRRVGSSTRFVVWKVVPLR